ncbi:MAG: hypothetical protein AAFY58_01130 [Planctomycetota bacterium]
MRTPITALIAAGLVASPALASEDHDHEHEGDVFLVIENDQIVTGILDEGVFETERVFGVEFGEILPGVADEPGFDNFAGTFAPASEIAANFMSELTAWNGTDLSPAAESLIFEFGPESFTSSTGFVPGIGIPVEANGEWHNHYDMLISDALAIGVYVMEMELVSTQTGLAGSESFWFVFNNGDSETNHDAAIDYVESVLVPTPAAATMFAVAGVSILRRRR